MKTFIPTGAKLFLGLAALAAAAAVVGALGSGGGLNGSFSFGLLGGVGDHVSVVVFGATAVVAAFLGGVLVAFRDADPDSVTEVLAADALPVATAPGTLSYWPVIGAVAAAVMMIGLTSSPVLFRFGAIFAGIALVEWAVHAWADRATGDPEANRQIRNRFMHPIEIPLFGALGIVVMVLSLSRVLLAVSEIAADVIAMGLATMLLVVAAILNFRPQLRRGLVVTVLAIFAVAVVAAGIVGAAHGTRDYEKHESHTEQESAPALGAERA